MSDVGMSAAFWTMKSLEEFCILKKSASGGLRLALY
jgi:hypothetical protein